MNVAVLGCGNMASAIVSQVYKANNDICFYTYTPTQAKAVKLANQVSGEIILDLSKIQFIEDLDFIIIACKPQQVDTLAGDLKKYLKKHHHLVSILAATSLEILQKKFEHQRITRIMPNTPCSLGQGISLCLHSKEVPLPHRQLIEDFFSLCSKVFSVKNDEELDLLTVVSGSGPAYVYEFASGILNFLLQRGVDYHLARDLTDQLFLGSSLLIANSTASYSALVDEVTSRGGVTIEAIKHYRELNLKDISEDALKKALERSKQIAQELGAK